MPSSQNHRLWCISHRGGKCEFSENTLGAFAHSLELGVDAIELDIWQVENELFVMHDRRLDKWLPGAGLIKDISLAAIKAIRLPCGSPIPTLTEVLTLVSDRCELNIELKDPDCTTLVCRTLESHVHDHGGSFEPYVISSFNHPQLLQCRQLLPQVRRGALLEGIPLDYAAIVDAVSAYSLYPGLNFLTPALVDDAHRRGAKVWVYTVNEADDLAQMLAWQVDGVFTDVPERVMALNQSIPG